MQVERQSVANRMESRSYSFSFYLERWQPSSCLIQEVHLWHVSFSLFHQHAPCTLCAARCFLPTQHLFDLIRSQEIDGCSIIVKITHRKSLSPLHPWKCQRACCTGSLSQRTEVFGWISSLVFAGELNTQFSLLSIVLHNVIVFNSKIKNFRFKFTHVYNYS